MHMISRKLTRANIRLERLEETDLHHRATFMQQIQKAAFQDLSDEDLNVMKAFIERGAPFSEPTPEESATLARYKAAGDAAERELAGKTQGRQHRAPAPSTTGHTRFAVNEFGR
jgi:hypothetical protein